MDEWNQHPEEELAKLAWVNRLAYSLVRDPSLAEDVAQESLSVALRSGARVLNRAWLASVVRNFARQRQRSERSRRRREIAVAQQEALPSTQDLILRTERQRLVIDAVMKLPELMREVVLLRYVDGYLPAEIARRLDLPQGTVRSHIKRALERLRQSLDGEYGSRETWALLLMPLTQAGEVTRANLTKAASPMAGGLIMNKLALSILCVVAALGLK